MTQKEFEQEWLDGEPFIVCHTSGSTGTPKEIRLSKEFMRESARRTNEFFGISESSRLHTCLDFQYIASKMMTVRADEAGCVLTSEVPSNRPLADISGDETIDLLSIVPSQMEWILDSLHTWRGLRRILIGGAPIPPLLRRRIALSDCEAWESYGMTETASHIALRRIGLDDSEPFNTLPGIEIYANDDGCLVVSLPGREPIVTNDLAEVKSSTEFRIIGRADNCIISGGIKVIPEELERLLGPVIAFEYCISSVPDRKWGERLVLVADVEESGLDHDFLKNAIGVRLNQYRKILNLGVKSPKEVICLKGLPRLTNGKIDRRALKSLLTQ